MKKGLILGIDTSNYTTSVAILTVDGELVANLKRPLPVKAGERGLRQSEAVFAHTVNIPVLMNEARDYLADGEVLCVGVSEKPRNQEGSYMPCFLSGVAAAESISAVNGVPLYRFSHQCGHIMAALFSSGRTDLLSKEFAAFHISGGTTELVRVSPSKMGFESCLLGGTADLNAGQIIDRVGVYAGLRFPAGPEMELRALENQKAVPKKKIPVNGMSVNLSGLENMAIKLYNESSDLPFTAAFVFDYIGRSILSMMSEYEKNYGATTFVCAGGVMCNSIIKRMLSQSFNVAFAEPAMSADNAVGIAALALRAYKTEK